jgi:hypothetical protein
MALNVTCGDEEMLLDSAEEQGQKLKGSSWPLRTIAASVGCIAAVAAVTALRGGSAEIQTPAPRASAQAVTELVASSGKPFEIDVNGGACAGGSSTCDAPGWVYCQDAQCSEPKMKHGVLVAECLCWAPPNTNKSSLPEASNAGASCVLNSQNKDLGLPEGGKAMCDAMKKGALISTYGPEGWKPPLVAQACPAKTQWAWCWGAPCHKQDGDIICDCPMMISNNKADQYISISQQACNLEENPCTYVHNGSPNGKTDIQRGLPQCKAEDKSGNNHFVVPKPFKIQPSDSTNKCAGGSSTCDAPGWVYCQDAQCSEPKVKKGVLVAECLCWAPPNTNESSLPAASNAGASCVLNSQNEALKLPEGGKAMCDAMKNGALISTYGPKGWKPPLVVKSCPAKTHWAWCWGAPCEMTDGDIICDCPMMISDNNENQYISISQEACNLEDDPCDSVHNSSPNGPSDIQKKLPECTPKGTR